MGKSSNGKDVRYHRVDLMSKTGAAKNGAKHFSIADDDDDSDSELVKLNVLSHPFFKIQYNPLTVIPWGRIKSDNINRKTTITSNFYLKLRVITFSCFH